MSTKVRMFALSAVVACVLFWHMTSGIMVCDKAGYNSNDPGSPYDCIEGWYTFCYKVDGRWYAYPYRCGLIDPNDESLGYMQFIDDECKAPPPTDGTTTPPPNGTTPTSTAGTTPTSTDVTTPTSTDVTTPTSTDVTTPTSTDVTTPTSTDVTTPTSTDVTTPTSTTTMSMSSPSLQR